jgi:hypothetical protein
MQKRKHQITAMEQGSCETPFDLQPLFGPAPLLEGEDAGAYDALQRRIHVAVAPADVIEEIWVRDLVDLVWETMRLRRLKATLMRASAHEGLEKLLTAQMDDWSYRRELLYRWTNGEPAAKREVKSLLEKAGLSEEAITAQTLAVKLEAIEKIDRMIMQTEARRNVILREVDRHRDVMARRLREASAAIEHAELAELPAPQQDAAE